MPDSPIKSIAEDLLLGYVHGAGKVTQGISGAIAKVTEPGSFAERRFSKASGKIHRAARATYNDAQKTIDNLQPHLKTPGKSTAMVTEHLPDMLMAGRGLLKAAINQAQGFALDYGKAQGVDGTLSGIAAQRLIKGNSLKANIKQMALERVLSEARLDSSKAIDPTPRG
jgi:hypothetical protein